MEREKKKLANASPARNRAIRYVNTCMLSQKIERLGIAEAGFFYRPDDFLSSSQHCQVTEVSLI